MKPSAGVAPLPPGPPRRKFRTMRQLAADPAGFFEALHRDYGDIVYYQIPPANYCIVFSSDLAVEALRDREADLALTDPSTPFDVIKWPNLVKTRGEEHQRLTRLMVSAFAEDRMSAYTEMLADHVEAHLERFRPGEAVDIRDEFERLSWNATFAALFGDEPPPDPAVVRPIERTLKLKYILDSVGAAVLLRLPLPFLLRALRAAKELDRYAYRAIRRAGDPAHPGDDVFSHFVRATRDGTSDWSFKNDREIRDAVYSILFPGYEPAIMVLTYATYYLHRNPSIRDRLEREADRVLGDRRMRGSDFALLPYAQAVCNEVLRVQPPAITLLPRKARRDCVLGGYTLPKDTVLQISPWVIHSRPDYWDRGNEFQPERWLSDAAGASPACPEHAFMPFGMEPRWCRGAQFATVLMVFALAGMARRFRLEPIDTELPKRGSTDVGFFTGPIFANVVDRASETRGRSADERAEPVARGNRPISERPPSLQGCYDKPFREDFNETRDDMARVRDKPLSLVATAVETIEADVETLFGTIADGARYADAVPDIKKIEFVSDTTVGLGARFRETRRLNGALALFAKLTKLDSTVIECTDFVANQRVRYTSDAAGALWHLTYSLQPVDESCTKLEVRLETQPYNAAGRIAPKLLGPKLRDTAIGALNAIKAYFERPSPGDGP